MICVLRDLASIEPFLADLLQDPDYSDPHLLSEEQMQVNLRNAAEKQNNLVLGVYDGIQITGLFVFLVLPEERYLEMIAGLSRSPAAYRGILDFLLACYPGFQADFVFNPRNQLLKELLEERKAAFDPVQRRMELADFKQEQDTAGIVPLSQRYFAEYCAMHSKDVYWTGEKVFHSPDRFRAFLAVEDGQIVGYVDVTHKYDTNEVYDLRVKEAFRRRGWGRKLMAKALAENRPNGMLLFVETDHDPAVRLYQSLGFEFVPEGDNQTAFWKIPC